MARVSFDIQYYEDECYCGWYISLNEIFGDKIVWIHIHKAYEWFTTRMIYEKKLNISGKIFVFEAVGNKHINYCSKEQVSYSDNTNKQKHLE